MLAEGGALDPAGYGTADQVHRRRRKYDALEPFHPDRIVSRILGMGDIMSLIEKAESQIDKKKANDLATKMLGGDGFSLEDFRDNCGRFARWDRFKA